MSVTESSDRTGPTAARDLRGAVVVVTGATGAAGPSAVTALAAAGATVVAVGRDQARLDELVANAHLDGRGGEGRSPNAGREGEGRSPNAGRGGEGRSPNAGRGGRAARRGRIETTVVDLLDEQATQVWGRELLATYGRVDGLVHLVGGWRGGAPIAEFDLADYTWLHDNLVRTFQHVSRALHDALAVSPVGRVVIVSTTLLDRPVASNAAYLTAKAGAEAWAQALAQSVQGTEAAVVILRIKALLTPQMRADKPDAAFTGCTPVGQLADAIVELFEEPAEEVNGETLDVLPG